MPLGALGMVNAGGFTAHGRELLSVDGSSYERFKFNHADDTSAMTIRDSSNRARLAYTGSDGAGTDSFAMTGADGNDVFAVTSSAASFRSDALTVKDSGQSTKFTVSGVSGAITATGEMAMGANPITGVSDPTNAQDVATKAYVDSVSTGLKAREAVRVATEGNVDISAVTVSTTVDGIELVAGDRVLIRDQTSPAQNGVYVLNGSDQLERAEHFATGDTISGNTIFVNEGVLHADTTWACSNNAGSDEVGAANLTFVQILRSQILTTPATSGLTITGNSIALDRDNYEIHGVGPTGTTDYPLDARADVFAVHDTGRFAPSWYTGGLRLPTQVASQNGSSTPAFSPGVYWGGAPSSGGTDDEIVGSFRSVVVQQSNGSTGVVAQEATEWHVQQFARILQSDGSTHLAVSAVDAGTDLLTTDAAHGLVAGDEVMFREDVVSGRLVANTVYYVHATGLTSTAFGVSASVGGAIIDIQVGDGGLANGSQLFAWVTRAKVGRPT